METSNSSTKTSAKTLIRVRNNQRRHRERRRQYIASLELKVCESENRLAQALASIATLQNEVLMLRLRCNEANIDLCDPLSLEHPKITDEEQSQRQAILQISKETSTNPLLDAGGEPIVIAPEYFPSLRFLTNQQPAVDHSEQHDLSSPKQDLLATAPQSGVRPRQSPENHAQPCCSTCGSYQSNDGLNAIPEAVKWKLDEPESLNPFAGDYPPVDVESTTPCEQAYVSISRLNFRGLELDAITAWLSPGFRKSNFRNEACRVESRLLFEVLDFISDS
jgi:hypothetical protein